MSGKIRKIKEVGKFFLILAGHPKQFNFVKYKSLIKIVFSGSATSPDPFDLGDLGNNLPPSTGAVKKTPQSFLGENSALVNLDNLVSASAIKPAAPTPTSKYYFIIKCKIIFQKGDGFGELMSFISINKLNYNELHY